MHAVGLAQVLVGAAVMVTRNGNPFQVRFVFVPCGSRLNPLTACRNPCLNRPTVDMFRLTSRLTLGIPAADIPMTIRL